MLYFWLQGPLSWKVGSVIYIKIINNLYGPQACQAGFRAYTESWAICMAWIHDDVIKWKHFPRNWSFVRGIHRSPVNSPHKSQWRGALMFSLICARINDWVNNCEAGDLRRHRGHYDVTIMILTNFHSNVEEQHSRHIMCVHWILITYHLCTWPTVRTIRNWLAGFGTSWINSGYLSPCCIVNISKIQLWSYEILWRYGLKTVSALPNIWKDNPLVIGGLPSQRTSNAYVVVSFGQFVEQTVELPISWDTLKADVHLISL